ncbi:hypothetical protein MMC31_007343 [Peltigera leucophlebia]|nr:hypothetical protein [Peltigera leucophlebia]
MVPSERAIALFLSQTSSTRNRALLYIGITDGNVDDAVALFNSKPDETFRAAISRPYEYPQTLRHTMRAHRLYVRLISQYEERDNREERVLRIQTLELGNMLEIGWILKRGSNGLMPSMVSSKRLAQNSIEQGAVGLIKRLMNESIYGSRSMKVDNFLREGTAIIYLDK